jgi:hypothetical protein
MKQPVSRQTPHKPIIMADLATVDVFRFRFETFNGHLVVKTASFSGFDSASDLLKFVRPRMSHLGSKSAQACVNRLNRGDQQKGMRIAIFFLTP